MSAERPAPSSCSPPSPPKLTIFSQEEGLWFYPECLADVPAGIASGNVVRSLLLLSVLLALHSARPRLKRHRTLQLIGWNRGRSRGCWVDTAEGAVTSLCVIVSPRLSIRLQPLSITADNSWANQQPLRRQGRSYS